MKINYSVIIPVYNAEQTLARCLDSLLSAARKVEGVEIICVDDGSTDGSLKLLEEYAAKDSRIIVRHQKNAGPSKARNLGLDLSKGEWVSFVDSDDEVAEDYFSAFETWQYKADINFFSMRWLYKTGEEELAVLRGHEHVSGRNDVAETCLALIGTLHKRNLFAFMPNKFFHNEIIRRNRIRFVEGLSLSEDEVFVFHVCLHVQTLSVMPDALYSYYVSDSGLTNNPNRPVERLSDIFYELGLKAKETPLKKLAFGASLALLDQAVMSRLSVLKTLNFVDRTHKVKKYFPLSRYCPRSALCVVGKGRWTSVALLYFRQVCLKVIRRVLER